MDICPRYFTEVGTTKVLYNVGKKGKDVLKMISESSNKSCGVSCVSCVSRLMFWALWFLSTDDPSHMVPDLKRVPVLTRPSLELGLLVQHVCRDP